MGFKIGNTDIQDIKLGNTQVNKVYLGTDLVWQAGAPITHVNSKSLSDSFEGITFQEIWDVVKNYQFTTDKYYIMPATTFSQGKRDFNVFKFPAATAPSSIPFSQYTTPTPYAFEGDNQYERQITVVMWNGTAWVVASGSTATSVVRVYNQPYITTDFEIVTTIPLMLNPISTVIDPLS